MTDFAYPQHPPEDHDHTDLIRRVEAEQDAVESEDYSFLLRNVRDNVGEVDDDETGRGECS